MKTRCIVVAAALAAVVTATEGRAQTTLDFESAPGNRVTAYGGFNFSGGAGAESWVNFNLAAFGTHSGTRHVWSNGGVFLDFSRSTAFDFHSVWLAAMNGSCSSTASPSQTVNGYRGGILAYSSTVNLSCSATNQYVFDFLNVDLVRFEIIPPHGANLLVDDLTFSEVGPEAVVPEPMSMILLGTGLVGIAGVARRRRRKN